MTDGYILANYSPEQQQQQKEELCAGLGSKRIVENQAISRQEVLNMRDRILQIIEHDPFFSGIFKTGRHNKYLSIFPPAKNNSIDSHAHFFHVVHFSARIIDSLKNAPRNQAVTNMNASELEDLCDICSNRGEYTKIYAEILIQKQHYINYLNAFLGVPLTVAQTVLSFYKPKMYTHNGTFSYDLILTVLSKLKSNPQHIALRFLGVLYSNHSVKPMANEILRLYQIGVRAFMIIYAVGTNLVPEHWCSYFVDINSRTIFFYNSLAKPEQMSNKLPTELNKLFKSVSGQGFSFMFNTKRQQYKNALCGIFAVHFLFTMIKTPYEKRRAAFKEIFDVEANHDQLIEQIQNEYVSPSANPSVFPFMTV